MKELLTGKNKEQFLNWMLWKRPRIQAKYGISLKDVPFEMQIGVLLAYYDSLEIYIRIDLKAIYNNKQDWSYFVQSSCKNKRGFKSRNEAYKEAFKLANKLINK
jgi:hypothetical protein